MSATKKILLVDDDDELRLAMQTVLEKHGYLVVSASDGNLGLSVAERENPDLVILDMMMPKKSGFLVLEKLKTRGEKSPKVMMVTANDGGRHRSYAEHLGVDHYLRKPFSFDDFMAAVRSLCPLTPETASPG